MFRVKGAGSPLSRSGYLGARLLATLMLAASIASVAVVYIYYEQLTWPYRVGASLMAVFFTFGLRDVRNLFLSYTEYKREWTSQQNPPNGSGMQGSG